MAARTQREADIRALWHQIFGDSPQAIESFFTAIYREEEALTLYDGDQLLSILLFPALELRIEGGLRLPVGYLCGVGTHPDHQRKGYSGKLLREALQRERQRGDIFSTLIPAEPSLFDFYRLKAGFFPAFSEYTTEDPASYAAHASYHTTSAETLLQFLSLQEAATNSPTLLHTPAWWQAVLQDYAQSAGYQLLTHRDDQGRIDGALFAMAHTEQALWVRALWGEAPVQRALVTELQDSFPGATIRYYLPTPAEQTPRPKGMARLLNIRKLLRLYLCQHPETQLTFAYRDPLFPEEDAYYILGGGQLTERPLQAGDQPLAPPVLLQLLELSPLHWRAYLLTEGEL